MKKIASPENVINVVKALINEIKVPVSSHTITSSLHAHPDYPSLLSISDCLKEWKIPNNSYEIDKSDYNPDDFSFPLVAHLQRSKSFILITSISNDVVSYRDGRKKNATMTEQEFLSQWEGVVLHAEPTSESGETAYNEQRFKGVLDRLRVPSLVTAVFAWIMYIIYQNHITWVFTALVLSTIAGLISSILLLMHSVNASNPLVQNLCSLVKGNDCNAILKSNDAKVADWLSWSEVGFFYFAGSLLALLMVSNAIPYLTILNLCCLPYTFWSVWYQYKIKNWCLLCCTVQALLWLQFIIFVVGTTYAPPVTGTITIAVLAFSFAFPIALWAFLKPFMLKAAQLEPLKQQLKKFKYNSHLFNQVLTNQPRFSVPNDIMPIVLGNNKAENIITMVSNPFCEPCATIHKTLEKWLNITNDIQVKIVFTTANHDDDPKTKVARHLTALSFLEDKKMVKQALNAWYESPKKDYDSWAKNYPMHINSETELITQRQKDWCESTEISFTPTILINGYKLPEPYMLEDLRYLLN